MNARATVTAGLANEVDAVNQQAAVMSWMQRLHRGFAIDVRTCPRSGARPRIIAVIDDPALVERILEHVDAREQTARAPPSVHAA